MRFSLHHKVSNYFSLLLLYFSSSPGLVLMKFLGSRIETWFMLEANQHTQDNFFTLRSSLDSQFIIFSITILNMLITLTYEMLKNGINLNRQSFFFLQYQKVMKNAPNKTQNFKPFMKKQWNWDFYVISALELMIERIWMWNFVSFISTCQPVDGHDAWPSISNHRKVIRNIFSAFYVAAVATSKTWPIIIQLLRLHTTAAVIHEIR